MGVRLVDGSGVSVGRMGCLTLILYVKGLSPIVTRATSGDLAMSGLIT